MQVNRATPDQFFLEILCNCEDKFRFLGFHKRKPTKSQVLVIAQIMAIAMAATRIILKMDGTMAATAEEVNAKN